MRKLVHKDFNPYYNCILYVQGANGKIEYVKWRHGRYIPYFMKWNFYI